MRCQRIHSIQRLIDKIDQLLNDQINAILHHPVFQKLEASWRGLYSLAVTVEKLNGAKLKIKLLNIRWSELAKDVMRAAEFDQSQLFRLIYNEEFGSPGGEPYGLLIGDYEISHQTDKSRLYTDISVLQQVARTAAAAFAPLIMQPSPSLFGLDDFSSLGRDLNLERTFQQHEYTAWKALRQETEMRFIGLILPKVLQRLPYHRDHLFKLPCQFDFVEHIKTKQDYVWGNPCYVFAANIARAFAHSGWFADIRGMMSEGSPAGTADDLPAYYFYADIQKTAPCFITEAHIIEHQEKNLSDYGFMALCHCKHTSLHAFYSCPSLYQLKPYTVHAANNNEKLSSMLNYVLCASRFAHYLKVIARNKMGSLITAQACGQLLEDWLRQYTAGGGDLSRELQAKYPLREARVDVVESIGNPGVFSCKVYLSPHYRFEQIETYLQLTTELR